MAGIIDGKDVKDLTIPLIKFTQEVQDQLIPHTKAQGDLSGIGSSITLSFDGITGIVTNTDGTFLTMQFTSDPEHTGVLMVRTVYAGSANSSQRLENQTLGSTPISFPPLTVGANLKVEIEIFVPDTSIIYNIIAMASSDLSTCAGYVEKI